MVGSVAGPAGRKDSLPFGGWTLDTRAGTLSQHGQPAARLRPKTAAVLAELLATPGVVVARNVLLDRVWPGLAVTDDSITQCVAEIRRALGEDGPWLRTVPRRGYVMDLPVPALPGLPVALGAGRRPPASSCWLVWRSFSWPTACR